MKPSGLPGLLDSMVLAPGLEVARKEGCFGSPHSGLEQGWGGNWGPPEHP